MYESKNELPDSVRAELPSEAQDLYLEAYNNAWENFDPANESGETPRTAVATRKAWATVKRDWVQDDETHRWYRRGEEPVHDDEEDKGLLDELKDMV